MRALLTCQEPVGAFFSQVGQLHEVHHIWFYPDMSTRKQLREAAWSVSGWGETVQQVRIKFLRGADIEDCEPYRLHEDDHHGPLQVESPALIRSLHDLCIASLSNIPPWHISDCSVKPDNKWKPWITIKLHLQSLGVIVATYPRRLESASASPSSR